MNVVLIFRLFKGAFISVKYLVNGNFHCELGYNSKLVLQRWIKWTRHNMVVLQWFSGTKTKWVCQQRNSQSSAATFCLSFSRKAELPGDLSCDPRIPDRFNPGTVWVFFMGGSPELKAPVYMSSSSSSSSGRSKSSPDKINLLDFR